jgi:hypothetical protein
MKQKNTTSQRLGAAALATATVVSGLAFGPGAVAAPAQSVSAVTPAASSATEPAAATVAADVGPFVAASTGSFNVTPGEEADVKVRLRATRLTGVVYPRLTLTAPEGMTFPVQSTAPAARRDSPDADWAAYPRQDMAGGTVTNAGKTLTFDGTSYGGAIQLQAEAEIEYTVKVRADPKAVNRPANALGFVYSGEAMSQDFSATGTVRTTSAHQIGPFVAASTGSFNVAPGGEADVKVRLRATRLTGVVYPRLTLTAPEGMTFPEQSTAPAARRDSPDADWAAYPRQDMAGGTVTNAGKTLTFDGTSYGGAIQLQAEAEIEYTVKVRADPQAVDRPSKKLGFVYSGEAMLNGFRANGGVPVSIVDQFGGIGAVEVEPTELERGTDTDVSVVVETASEVTSMTSKLTFTAPSGTTFADAEDRAVSYLKAGESTWRQSAYLGLTGGVLSPDRTTLTYDADVTGDGFSLPTGSRLKFSAPVVTPGDAVDADGLAMSFVHAGTSNAGAFHATGAAPVSIVGDAGDVSAVEVESVDLERGSEAAVSGVVEVSSEITSMTSKVTLEAPSGTTFANADDRAVPYLLAGESDWRSSSRFGFRNGVLSDDATSVTYDLDATTASFRLPVGSRLKFSAPVVTPADAVDADGLAMSFVHVGTSNAGAFHATGTAPVSIVGDFGTIVPVEADAAELERGTTQTVFPIVQSNAIQEGLNGTVTFTAPEGTSFPEQATAEARWRPGTSGAWSIGPVPALGLVDGTVGDGGKTLTFTFASPGSHGANQQYRYAIQVSTAQDAADVEDNALGYVMKGSSTNQGAFQATGKAPVTIVSSYTDVTLDNFADGDTFTPGDVTFSGTGTPGATVTVAPATGPGVSTEVRSDGTWSAVRYLGNAAYTMSVSQTAASGENKLENIRLFSDAVVEQDFSVTSPASGDGHAQQGWVTFSGQGTTWSTVSISDGSSAAPTRATVQYDGSWTAKRWVGTEKTTFTVTSSRADVQNGSQTIEYNTGVSGQAFSLDSHTDGGTFTPGNVVFRGKGSTGDKVTFTAPGLAPLEATVNAAGEWSIPRWLGNGFITFTVTHTPVTGDETKQTLRLFSDQVPQGELVVPSPVDGDGHEAPGWVTFTGTGTTWSTISISDGTSAAPSTATVQYDGSWTINRWVGTSATTFTVTSERADIANGSETIEFNVGDVVDDFTIGSHTDGGTFTPGNVTITGTGSTGDTVTITAPGLAPLEAEVDSRGKWSIQRWLGNGFITFTVTHTPKTGDETKQTLRLFSDQVAQGELTVTAPVDGDSHAQQGWVTFTGTGTTWSKVSVSDGTSAAPSTATVQYDGSWTIRRWVGTAPVTFTITSERADIANGSKTIRFNTAD